MNINKRLDEIKSSGVNPVTALNWALSIHRDAPIVLADSGNKTLIGAQYDGEHNYFVECSEDEIEGILKTLIRRAPVLNYKIPRGKKSISRQNRMRLLKLQADNLRKKGMEYGLVDTTWKVIVTRLRPGRVLRLFWQVPNADAPGGFMRVQWQDIGRDGNMEPEAELRQVLQQHDIAMTDVIREDK